MSTDFGLKLKAIREENGWTLDEMAERLQTTKQALSRYERGERIPKITVAAKFADALGVPLEELAGIDQPEKPHHVDYGKHGLSDEDNAILEALHQNPELGLLFDRTKHMSKDDMNFMLRVADGIKRERNGE